MIISSLEAPPPLTVLGSRANGPGLSKHWVLNSSSNNISAQNAQGWSYLGDTCHCQESAPTSLTGEREVTTLTQTSSLPH
jgi:hypothetical protein